jgi:NIMA-interacting peptidyl-prolyl cis-trans isomerase 1
MAASLENEDIDEAMFGMDDEESDPQGQAPQASAQPLMAGERPPPPLPPGWFLKQSHSNPGYFYYFNQDTGECCWDIPTENTAVRFDDNPTVSQDINATAAAAAAAVKSILKRSSVAPVIDSAAVTSSQEDEEETKHARKKHKHDKSEKKHHSHRRSSTDSADSPKEVRVLHILKKHNGSRRPSSWRVPKITISKEKAMEELNELRAILQEVGDASELRATFEELAKTESDCSSAKRGGDLGFFGRKKMQPAFEKASFGLKVGALSNVVDTSSGVHIILRLA